MFLHPPDRLTANPWIASLAGWLCHMLAGWLYQIFIPIEMYEGNIPVIAFKGSQHSLESV